MTTTAELARDRAIDRVATSHEAWIARVLAWIRSHPLAFHFTTDDLWKEFEHPPEPRAAGAAIRIARTQGLIAAAGYRKSERAECHARPVTVWCRVSERGC